MNENKAASEILDELKIEIGGQYGAFLSEYFPGNYGYQRFADLLARSINMLKVPSPRILVLEVKFPGTDPKNHFLVVTSLDTYKKRAFVDDNRATCTVITFDQINSAQIDMSISFGPAVQRVVALLFSLHQVAEAKIELQNTDYLTAKLLNKL